MVKILHTSDWHVGKTIRGLSRAEEHKAALHEIAGVAEEHQVDVVVVAGDLYETSAPKPESEAIVYDALLAFADTGATVVVVSGNHDNAHRLRAVSPLLDRHRIHVLTEPTPADEGGVRRLTVRSGEELALGMLPFVSQRGIVRVDQLMQGAAYEHAQAYADKMRGLIEHLSGKLEPSLPGLLVTHAFVHGGQTGGGERQAHILDEYAVVAQSFPATLGYVALGHLHRAQKLPGGTAIHYCGSPLQLDFGESSDVKQVNVVDLVAGKPAKVKAVMLESGCRLVTLKGSVSQVAANALELDPDCWIRARVDEPRRAGLADELRDAMGAMGARLVDVLVTAEAPAGAHGTARPSTQGRSPRDLFDEFLITRGISDERVGVAFDAIYQQASDPAEVE